MTDDDLIRRGDAMTVADAELRRYGFGELDGGRCDQMREAIAALPAVTVPQGVDALQAAGRHMLALHDGFLSGADVDIAAAKRLHLAASFGAQAFAVCPIPDARPAAMMRAIALALIDPMHPNLDYLRMVNMARPVEAPHMTDLMVDPESIDAFLEANPLTPTPVDDSLAANPAVKPTLAEALAVPEVKALVSALILARVHVANNEQGWSVGRGAARSDLEIVNAALRQIGGEA